MTRVLITVVMLFIASISFAKKKVPDNKPPMGCRDLGYDFKHQQLYLYPGAAGTRQSMYFVRNESSRKIYLNQLKDSNFEHNTYNNNAIHPQKWAVYASDENVVRFACTTTNKNLSYLNVVDCKNILKVCEYDNVLFGLNNKGNYWAVSSNSKKGARRAVNRQGVLLRP